MYLRGAETEWWAGGAWAWMSKRGGREHGVVQQRERERERERVYADVFPNFSLRQSSNTGRSVSSTKNTERGKKIQKHTNRNFLKFFMKEAKKRATITVVTKRAFSLSLSVHHHREKEDERVLQHHRFLMTTSGGGGRVIARRRL